MKLPDFFSYDAFVQIKRKMGIPADQIDDVTKPAMFAFAGDEYGEAIARFSDFEFPDEVSIFYQGTRVVLYIRDAMSFEPRFHVAHCKTLIQKRADGTDAKYVASVRTDGNFRVCRNASGDLEESKLDVCQNCLIKIHWNNFNSNFTKKRRNSIIENFSLSDFFNKYPSSLHKIAPTHDEYSAPANTYSKGFEETSRAYRIKSNFRCDQCGWTATAAEEKRFMHTHHINGLRWDDRDENLRVLCLECHADQPAHAHMKRTSEYRDFVRMRRRG